jgi:trans-aconitate 2-methyltransferase
VSGATRPRDWDAATYDRVARPQREWAKEVLERLPLRGDETVLDAGCGTGGATRLLLERLPRGRVIGVDGSPAMIAKARETLGDHVELHTCDLLELELGKPVDAIFSNATFHWITDHDRLFRRLHDALRPGGCLVAQCGGKGNVARVSEVGHEVGSQPPFQDYFEGWRRPWRFAGAKETQALLEGAGFSDVRCWLEPRPARIPPEDARAFLRTVCLGSHLEVLPGRLHDDFVAAVRERLPGPTLMVGYVRLNIEARRPGSRA